MYNYMIIKKKRAVSFLSHSSFIRQLEALLQQNEIQYQIQPVSTNGTSSSNKPVVALKSQPLIGYIETYMETHLAEPLNLDELAKQGHLSKYQLIRRFKASKGITPWKYLIKKRIERAQQLLTEGLRPVEVAHETGFYDQSHLHHAFQKKTGFTPKEYQQEHFSNSN